MQDMAKPNFEIMVDAGRFKSALGIPFYSLYQQQISSLLYRFFKNEPRKIKVYFIESFGFSGEMEFHACHSDSIKVFFIFNLTKNTIPLLRYADLIFFFNSAQQNLYKETYKITKPNEVIAFHPLGIADTGKKNELLLFFSWHYKPFEYFKLIKELKERLDNYKNKDLEKVNVLFQFPLAKKDKIIDAIRGSMPCVEVYSFDSLSMNEQLEAAFLFSRYSEVFEEDPINDPFNFANTFESKVEVRSLDYNLSSNIAWNLMAQCGANGADQLKADASSEISLSNPEIDILNVVRMGYPDIDNHDDLHILLGSTLSNKYVVSIFFRNIGAKLQRCIDKLVLCAKHYDVGFVLVDDGSEDSALERMLGFFKKLDFDCVIIKNRGRKFSARNYYNVIHNIVTNDDSVIVDMEGGDYLNDHIDVFGVLDKAYADGSTLKTIGSFLTNIEESGEECATLKRKMYLKIIKECRLLNDFSDPWNQSRAQAWMQLRTGKRSLLKQVEVDYYLERNNRAWLQSGYESIINSRAIELSNGKIKLISEPLYIYDVAREDDGFSFPQGLDSGERNYELYRAYVFENIDRKLLL